jgi:hypothetical protein
MWRLLRRACLPPTVKELQVFLGLGNFYRRFLLAWLSPFFRSLMLSWAASERLTWMTEIKAGFMAAKAALSRATFLGHPDFAAQLALYVNASASHIGAALHQLPKGQSSNSLLVSSPTSWGPPSQVESL